MNGDPFWCRAEQSLLFIENLLISRSIAPNDWLNVLSRLRVELTSELQPYPLCPMVHFDITLDVPILCFQLHQIWLDFNPKITILLHFLLSHGSLLAWSSIFISQWGSTCSSKRSSLRTWGTSKFSDRSHPTSRSSIKIGGGGKKGCWSLGSSHLCHVLANIWLPMSSIICSNCCIDM